MPVYGCLSPDGYKNTEQAWLNPDAMTRRLSFVTGLASRGLPISAMPVNHHPSQSVDASQLADTLSESFSDQTQSAIASSPPQLRAALILGSPEFMHY